MDNKQNNNKKFYKNQNFYVALIVAICLITATTVVVIRNREDAETTNTNITDMVNGEMNNESASGENETDESAIVDEEEVEEINEDKGLSIVVEDKTISESEESVATNTAILENLKNPVDGSIVYPFRNGEIGILDPTDKTNKTPRGIGIKADLGAEVKASADGIVEYVGFDGKYGNVVVLKHGDALRTVYANLDENKVVQVGQEVKCGDVVGKVGESAAYFAKMDSHLHFEVITSDESYETVMSDYNNHHGSFADPSEYLNLK